jgi:hypothetical protein
MNSEEIKIGMRAYDRNQHRTGTVLAVHRPANPNLSATEALVRTDASAVSWIRFEHLEAV